MLGTALLVLRAVGGSSPLPIPVSKFGEVVLSPHLELGWTVRVSWALCSAAGVGEAWPHWFSAASPGAGPPLQFLHFSSVCSLLSLPGRRISPQDVGWVGRVLLPLLGCTEKEGVPSSGKAAA